MKTVQITEDAVLKAHNEASPKGKTLLENLFGNSVFQKDIKERIKTFADVLQYHKIDEKTFEDTCTGLTIDEIAYKKIKLFVEALNEGWIPDWQNDNQWKYFPWFDFDDSSSAGRFSFGGSDGQNSVSYVGSRLCFKTRELSNYAGKQFEYIYRDFLTIK